MKQFKVKDNSTSDKEAFAEIKNLVSCVADKTLEQLQKEGIFVFPDYLSETSDFTKEQMILQSFNTSYRTSNVMGYIGVGDERLVIESRFSNGGEDYFFQYLLEKVLDFPNLVNLESNANQENKLFHLLLFLFASYLKSAMRKGVFKTYIETQHNDTNIKGTIDVARHLKVNTPFVGTVAYKQREYSYDNALMQLVRLTIEFIKSKSCGKQILGKAKDEVKLVMEATPSFNICNKRKIINNNKKTRIRHAYYREYGALQQLCLLILQQEKHQIGTGSRKVFGILFDGAWLWEEYVYTLLEKNYYHPMNKGGNGAQWLFAGNKGLIYPDFISKNSEFPVVADAKYKPARNIGNHDYLQILAYMFRFDAKKAYFFYPENQGGDNLELHVNQGSSYEKNVAPREDARVVKLGLQIPEVSIDYLTFCEYMKIAEEKFVTIAE